jgi:hypothetical protein
MASTAENQRFSMAGRHDLNPLWFLSTRVLFQVFECPNVVGSGAVVPCGDRPLPALRTVRAACHRTRLALYALLERLFVREYACMKLVMAVTTKDQCFPVAGRHHALPKRLSFCHIFQFSYMMHLKWPFRRLTILALLLVEPFDDFGEAQRPNVSVEWDIELRVVQCWFSEVFKAKDTDVACLLLSFNGELETLLRLEPFDNLVHARFVLVRQGFQKTRLPDPFQLVQGLFHTRCQGVIVCQSPKLSVVGKNDFGIGEVHPLRFVRCLASSIVSVSSLRTELLHFVLGNMKLDLFRERFYPSVAGAALELDNAIR